MSDMPKSIDEMDDKQFEEYSDKVAKGEIQPFPEDDEKKEVETPAPKKEEEKSEKSESEPKTEEEDKTKTEDDDEDDNDNDKGNKLGDDDKKSPPSMPLSKYKKQKENWERKLNDTVADIQKKHQEEMDDLKKSISKPEADKESVKDDIDAFAKENNISDPNVIKGLVEVIRKSIPGIDPETKKLLSEFQESRQKSAEEIGFEKDFMTVADPALKKLNPNIDDKHLKQAKDKLKELAYDDKYLKLDLSEIIALKQKDFTFNLDKKKTVETSRPGSKTNDKVQDYENWTNEDIDNASDEEFTKYSEYMASKSPSRFKVTDKNGNEVK